MLQSKLSDGLESLKDRISKLRVDSSVPEAIDVVNETLEEIPQCCELHCLEFLYVTHMAIASSGLDAFDSRVSATFHNTAVELILAHDGSQN